MEIKTRDFGIVNVEENDIVTFVQPILGFDELEKFVFLFDENECPEFVWLQSIEDENICFILADPRILKQKYNPKIPKSLETKLGAGEKLLWLITVVHSDFAQSTVNLKSPIILNPETKKATQLVLEQKYSIRQPII